MAVLDHAIVGLEQALEKPRHQMWRRLVRHRVASVQNALAGENAHAADAWLAARQALLARERDALLRKLDRINSRVLDSGDVEGVRTELTGVVSELRRHRQRLSDLVYDTVALELGGSE